MKDLLEMANFLCQQVDKESMRQSCSSNFSEFVSIRGCNTSNAKHVCLFGMLLSISQAKTHRIKSLEQIGQLPGYKCPLFQLSQNRILTQDSPISRISSCLKTDCKLGNVLIYSAESHSRLELQKTQYELTTRYLEEKSSQVFQKHEYSLILFSGKLQWNGHRMTKQRFC